MIEPLSSELMAHLWQSTLVVGLVWLATLALRANRPSARYWLWRAASLKFLVPFSWLVSLGAQFQWRTAPAIVQPAASFVMEEILAPPVLAAAPTLPTAQPAAVWPWVLASVWAVGFLVVLFWWWRQWRPVGTALRQARPVEWGTEFDVAGLVVLSSPSAFEPGVVGIWRPVLLLPESLPARLTPTQLNALIAHERCHIRSHDNLTAAIHMLVEALFWFHPLVWWIERRLIDERERACDEAVLRAGNDPADYAEGILAVCRFTVRAPLACVTGVSGSDLRARIESIVRNEPGARMSFSRRVAVAFFVLGLIGIPIVSGLVRPETPLLADIDRPEQATSNQASDAQQASVPASPVQPPQPLAPLQVQTGPSLGSQTSPPAPKPAPQPALGQASATNGDSATPSFEVASIKQAEPGRGTRFQLTGSQFMATNVTLRRLVLLAYELRDFQIDGLPEWNLRTPFEVLAKVDDETASLRFDLAQRRMLLMLRSLLAERFKLSFHIETRESPVFDLVLARDDRRLGPQLRPSSVDCEAWRAANLVPGAPPTNTTVPKPGERPTCAGLVARDRIAAGAMTILQLTNALSTVLGRRVVDKTDLAGGFDFDLQWTPDQSPQGPPTAAGPSLQPTDPNTPSIFVALQEQLGLKLESTKGPVDVLVIDHVELPTPD